MIGHPRPLILLSVILAAVGCGGAGTPAQAPAGGAAASHASACAQAFNAEHAADFGRHAFTEHDSRTARVGEIDGECAVVFAVAEDDPEYGTLGIVREGESWIPLNYLGRRRATSEQRAAAGAVNADVRPSGEVVLR